MKERKRHRWLMERQMRLIGRQESRMRRQQRPTRRQIPPDGATDVARLAPISRRTAPDGAISGAEKASFGAISPASGDIARWRCDIIARRGAMASGCGA